MCGVVSYSSWENRTAVGDSPHVRGCIALYCKGFRHSTGFPACAGLYRTLFHHKHHRKGIPRICGVVSDWRVRPWQEIVDSPHVRGCIVKIILGQIVAVGFPTCAGLYRDDVYSCLDLAGIPRMCGVVSGKCINKNGNRPDSPHVRGCIDFMTEHGQGGGGFPACAGLYLKRSMLSGGLLRIPRMCGVVSRIEFRK